MNYAFGAAGVIARRVIIPGEEEEGGGSGVTVFQPARNLAPLPRDGEEEEEEERSVVPVNPRDKSR